MGTGRGVSWPAMLEMWTIDFGEGGSFFLFVLFLEEEEEEDDDEERKWEMASWVVRIGWTRLMSRLA